MRALICAAMLALTATAAAEVDVNSANFMLPYCKAYVATNGGRNANADCAHHVMAPIKVFAWE